MLHKNNNGPNSNGHTIAWRSNGQIVQQQHMRRDHFHRQRLHYCGEGNGISQRHKNINLFCILISRRGSLRGSLFFLLLIITAELLLAYNSLKNACLLCFSDQMSFEGLYLYYSEQDRQFISCSTLAKQNKKSENIYGCRSRLHQEGRDGGSRDHVQPRG